MTYYNTTNETGQALRESEGKAKTQTEKVLFLFKANHHRHFTPFDVQRHLGMDTPVTSYRRAISDLTKEGYLEKTPHKIVAKYGAKNHAWKLKPLESGKQIQLEL